MPVPNAAPVEAIPPAQDNFRNAAWTGASCTILEMWGTPFAGKVRGVFLNSHACKLMASRDGPRDETPSSVRAGGIFRSGRFRRFSGPSRLASRPDQRGSLHPLCKTARRRESQLSRLRVDSDWETRRRRRLGSGPTCRRYRSAFSPMGWIRHPPSSPISRTVS
jgi:hypothetical protein